MLKKTLKQNVVQDFDEVLWERLVLLSLSKNSAKFLPDIIQNEFVDTYEWLSKSERELYLKILAELDGRIPTSRSTKVSSLDNIQNQMQKAFQWIRLSKKDKTSELKKFMTMLAKAQHHEEQLEPKKDKTPEFYKKRSVHIVLLWQKLAKMVGVSEADIYGITNSILSRPSVNITMDDLPATAIKSNPTPVSHKRQKTPLRSHRIVLR